jgi:uncharacterized protein YmfQ (DUF2313 family)
MPTNPRMTVAALLLALVSAPAHAQEAVAPDVAADLTALKAEHEKAQKAFDELYEQCKTNEERKKVYDEHYPKGATFAARARELAAKDPKDPAAVDALVWGLQLDPGSEGDSLLDALQRDHLKSPKLAEACQSLQHSHLGNAEKLLRAARSESPHAEVRGHACYSLAKVLDSRASVARLLQAGAEEPMVKRWTELHGAAWVERERKRDVDAAMREAEGLLEEVIASYGDVNSQAGAAKARRAASARKNLGTVAKGDLFELRNLAVGKTAPEIEGEDVDGVKFKLSDYRGKVVFLDFWGFW